MLHFLFAPDSLKGSLSASQACVAMERGAGRALAERPHHFISVPLADGGEGTVAAMLQGTGGRAQSTLVHGPLNDPVEAQWGVLPDGRAIIEMAQASGLTLVPPDRRRAGRASSYGTGEVIRAALDVGCRELLIGIGGSATTDGGAGALQALGARFLNAQNQELSPGGAALRHLSKIDLTNLDVRLTETSITVLCDVTNPLCGPGGAAHVYGPQKGATPQEVEELDAALQHFAQIAAATLGHDLQAEPGAGAAGGIGFGLMSFLGAQLRPGIEVVLEATHFKEKLEAVDLVLTAEGSIDAQTLHGKALAGVARAARGSKNAHGVPVIAFGGTVKLSGDELQRLGITAALPLPDAPLSLDECIARTDALLADATERAVRLWLCGRDMA
jgi:glycerate kinase